MKNKSKELNALIRELKETWGYTQEELADIREKIKDFAFACLMDSDVRKDLISEKDES